MPETEYLCFERYQPPRRVTPVVFVYNKRSGAPLGEIRWNGPWRQFVFAPMAHTVFSDGCMDDIRHQIDLLRRERKAAQMRASRCKWCGDSPGHYVCGEADRTVFACSNYVEGDDEGDPARHRYGYVRP